MTASDPRAERLARAMRDAIDATALTPFEESLLPYAAALAQAREALELTRRCLEDGDGLATEDILKSLAAIDALLPEEKP